MAALNLGIQLMQVFYLDFEFYLLPPIEAGLLDDRYKETSLRLLGYLLARCAGVYDLNLEPDAMQASDGASCKVDGQQMAQNLGMQFFEASALDGVGIDDPFTEIGKILHAGGDPDADM